jgi:hypothetical protein
MPKRVVKQKSWEILSEEIDDPPALKRSLQRRVVKSSLKRLANFERNERARQDMFEFAFATFAAFHSNNLRLANQYANEILEFASQKMDDPNVGDALHAGHTVLGLLALKLNDIATAVEQLQASAQIPSSAVLHSFGPQMWLAKALLENSETQAVIDFLNQCGSFWTRGTLWIEVWQKKILKGRIPNFSSNLLM